jgi:eukaryotic-like serine/threonine-protein kinase
MDTKKHFSEEEALYYFTMLLITLEYLHLKGTIHRDFKPSNIFIQKYDGDINILKVGDFGISKADIESIKKTITATLKGLTTPAYKAPEVIRGNYPSAKVDIWALGVILYRLIAALKYPFGEKNLDIDEMNRAIKKN